MSSENTKKSRCRRIIPFWPGPDPLSSPKNRASIFGGCLPSVPPGQKQRIIIQQNSRSHDYVKKLVREAKFHARGLQIPEGAAESFIECALKEIPKKVLKSDDEDLIRRTFIKNLAKYNRDYAYVLKNYQAML